MWPRSCRSSKKPAAVSVAGTAPSASIGAAAAMGVVLGMQPFNDRRRGAYAQCLRAVTAYLRTSRPTAVNLFWALERMEKKVQPFTEEWTTGRLNQALLEEALAIEEED